MSHVLLAVAFKTSLLMCVGGIVSLALARACAAMRHIVWISALALALLLPLASLVMPSFAVMDDPWAVPAQAAAAMPPSAVAQEWSDLLWPGVLAVWVVGTLLFLLRDTLGHAGLSRFRRHARPLASAHWTSALQALADEPHLRVLESDRVAGPCTWGFLKPVLVLPQAEGWSEAERRYALTHELAHIRRRDYVSTFVARLACALHWYNPLVWYAARQAHKLQEQACDDAVLRAGAVPSDYARLLVAVARCCSASPRAAMGMAERSPLYHRVTAILDPRKVRGRQSRIRALATFFPLALVMAVIAGAGLAEPEKALAMETVAAPAKPLSVAAAPAPAAPAKPVTVPARRRHAHAATPATPATPPDEASMPAPAVLDPVHPLALVPPIPPIPPLPVIPPVPPLPLHSE